MILARPFPGLVRAGALLAAAISLTACDVVVNSIEGVGGVKATDTWTRTYTVEGAGAGVTVVNVNGRIEVEAVDGNQVDVRAEITARGGTEQAAKDLLKQVQILEEASPAQIRLETKHQKTFGRQGVEVKYFLKVPKTIKVSLETVNGGINVVGVEGGVQADTTNGGVQGRLLSNSVRATTTNGGIKLQLSSLGGDGVELETTNGGIELQLPENAKATLAVRCVNGGISVNGLDLEKTGESSRRRLDGRINGGGTPVRAETVNGGIRIGKI